jgi:predicted RNA-binding protein with PUA domain
VRKLAIPAIQEKQNLKKEQSTILIKSRQIIKIKNKNKNKNKNKKNFKNDFFIEELGDFTFQPPKLASV